MNDDVIYLRFVKNKTSFYNDLYLYNSTDYRLSVKILNSLFDGSYIQVELLARIMITNAGYMQRVKMDLQGPVVHEFDFLYSKL